MSHGPAGELAKTANRAFGGIICLGGEDWWYHNRGHFDFQIMRRLARHVPVLFVNSLGVRVPNPATDRRFAERISRKLKSLSRGLVQAEPNFWVFSPAAAPGRTGQLLTDWALAPQIRLAAKRAGIDRPLLWVHCPAGAALIDAIPAVATVLQRTDRFEAFPDGDPIVLGRQIATLKRVADLAIYCAPHLAESEVHQVRRQVLCTHGVDLARFAAAGCGAAQVPDDVAAIPGPRVGFIGGIDHHTFDPALFLDVADRLRDHQFVLVGGCSLADGWTGGRSNIHLLGRRPYDAISDYMAAMDALIMPWNQSEWIAACNPIKLKEYLAVRRPVVTTGFPALDDWRDVVSVANDADTFAAAVQAAVQSKAPDLSARLACETWDAKAEVVLAALDDVATAAASRADRDAGCLRAVG